MRAKSVAAAALLVVVLLCTNLCSASTLRGQEEDPQVGPLRHRPEKDPAQREIERNMARQRATQRYADLKKDTERLLELATELKQYVDRSGEHVLSLEVIKKTEEMEKLAKKVRERMRGD